ncbi:MAG TPA: SRPBCC family protein [Candidatus Dormibacteraeota bacterium]|nr:SRPBCC family protein [Candidatus Dormibacteraeota bacterium]
MAYNASYSVTVKAPQQRVFDYVADVSRHGEWGSADDHMKASAEKPGLPAVGSRYKAEGMLNGKLNSSTVTITALNAPKSLAFDAEDSNSIFHHEFTFSPSGDGTLVERHVSMTRGPFYFPIVLTVFKSTVQKNYNGAMQNLKTKMDSSG